jgi:hypothetical protein
VAAETAVVVAAAVAVAAVIAAHAVAAVDATNGMNLRCCRLVQP